jgi:putative flippase GtrA
MKAYKYFFKETHAFLKYVLSGAISLLVNLVVTFLFNCIISDSSIPIILGFISGLVVVGFLNSQYTFYVNFNTIVFRNFIIVSAINLVLVYIISYLMAGKFFILTILFYTPIVTIVGFLLNKFFVFNSRD